jgi:hypothetical protein
MDAMNEEKPCRHEYVRIFQRKLKGLDRRLVSTKAFLPIGFKVGDFSHLGENSYCFCTKCRARLYPRRTQADKLAARVALAQGKAAGTDFNNGAELAATSALGEIDMSGFEGEAATVSGTVQESSIDIHVEELELESVDAQDIAAEGVKLAEDGEESSLADEDI